MTIRSNCQCLLHSYGSIELSSESHEYNCMMWLSILYWILSHLNHHIILHIAMMHQLQYKELWRDPQNQSIKLTRICLNNRYNHRGHFEAILGSSMKLHSSVQWGKKDFQLLRPPYMIWIKRLTGRILRYNSWRRLCRNSIMSFSFSLIRLLQIASHHIDQELIMR